MPSLVLGSARAQFTITLSAAVAEPVSVDWMTRDGTALAGRDYESNSGRVVFGPGETSKTVEVFVHGRTVETEDRVFYVLMLPPANAILADEVGACVIHVDTTGSKPVMTVVIPKGEKGERGYSAYEIALQNGFVGTEAQWLESLRPSPEELAPLVAKLIDAGQMRVTASGTASMTPPDTATIADFAGRAAYMRKTKKAVATALADGVNVVPLASLVGEQVDPNNTTGFNLMAIRSGALAPLQWEYLPESSEFRIADAKAGDVPIALTQDVGMGDISKASIEVEGIRKQLRKWLKGIEEEQLAREQLEDDLADFEDPLKGAAKIGRSVIVLDSVKDLQKATKDSHCEYSLGGFYPGSAILANPLGSGGGKWRYDPGRAKSQHNGGTVCSPTVPWDGLNTSLEGFLSGAGETDAGGKGCFVREFDMVLVTDFGAIGDGLTNNRVALAAANAYVKTRTSKRSMLAYPGGNYAASEFPNYCKTGMCIVPLGEVYLTNTGIGATVTFDAGPVTYTNDPTPQMILPKVMSMTFGNGPGRFIVQGGASTGGGIYLRGVFHSKICADVWGCGTTKAAVQLVGSMVNEISVCVTPGDAGHTQWFGGGRPMVGFSLGDHGVQYTQSSYNTFINSSAAGCVYGGYFDGAFGTTWIGGTMEWSIEKGLVMTTNCINSKIYSLNLEENGRDKAHIDAEIAGKFNDFISTDSVNFVIHGQHNHVVGGNHDVIEMSETAEDTILDRVRYGRGITGKVIIDRGKRTTRIKCTNLNTGRVEDQPLRAEVLVASGTSFSYTNNTGNDVRIHGSGGTVGNLTFGQPGADGQAGATVSLPWPMAMLTLRPREYVTMTYNAGAQPTNITVFHG